MNLEGKKILVIVSTGRCGTVRLTQIMEKNLSNDFFVMHQQKNSRIANIIGNISYYVGGFEKTKRKIFSRNLQKTDKNNIIITDPLVSMMIPKEMIKSENVAILNIYRDAEKFAESFYKFSRKKFKSFIAHNFIPFWQIGVFPLQNLIFGRHIKKYYKKVAQKKYSWFQEYYSENHSFKSVEMKKIFSSNILVDYIESFFEAKIYIGLNEFHIKSNTSS